MTKREQKGHTLLKAATTIVVVGSALYTAYQLCNNQQSDDNIKETNSYQDLTGGAVADSQKKLPKNSKITLVVTGKVLQTISEHNDKCEQGIDIQEYLGYYPGLVLLLYPGISIEDLETYFEIDRSLLHRFIPTTKEESIFHVAKQLGSSINLFNFHDFKTPFNIIIQESHIDNFLKNLTDMKDRPFTDFI